MRLTSASAHRLAAVVAALAVATLAVGAAPAPNEDEATRPDLRVARLSVPATPALLAGVVRDVNGAPAAGVDVTLIALPTQAEFTATKVGDSLPATPIGGTKTAAAGTYSLAPDSRLTTWRNAHPTADFVNVEIVAATSTGVMATSMTFRLGATTSTGTRVLSASGQDVSAQPATLDFQLAPAASPPVAATAPPAVGGGGATTAAARTYSCFTYQRDLGQAKVTLGTVRSRTADFRGPATYTSGTSNTLGAGYSTTGGYGSFSATGTVSWSADTQLNFATATGVGTSSYRTEMRYGLYYGTGCSPAGVSYYRVFPSAWVGSALTERATATPTIGTYCANYSAGGGITKSSGTNAALSTGAATAAMIGISLSSKAEWSSKFVQTITRTTAGQICGTSNYPGASSPGNLGVK